MKPASFEYHAPTTVDEAADLLAELGDEAKILAGGQSLVPVLAIRLSQFEHLVDLNGVAALRGTSRVGDRIRIEAMTRQRVAERDPVIALGAPLLAVAIPHIGHFQIRNRGTVGGSLAHADPASELPAVALALDADLEIRRAGSPARRIRASDFFVSIWSTALEADEILTAVEVPVWGARSGFALEEVARRHGDFALVGAACGVEIDGSGSVARAAISLFGVGSTPHRAEAAERGLVGARPDVDLVEVGRVAAAELEPFDDVHASSAYRKQVAAVVTSRALARALEEAHRG